MRSISSWATNWSLAGLERKPAAASTGHSGVFKPAIFRHLHSARYWRGSVRLFDSRLLVSMWCRAGEDRVSPMALGLSKQLGMTPCIMSEARVGHRHDKRTSIQRHYEDTARVYTLGSTKCAESGFGFRLAFAVSESCRRYQFSKP